MSRVRKFYKTVDVADESGAFVVRLDGKPVKTPLRALLSPPNKHLAEAIAEEWRAQDLELDPATMPLTRLAYAAIDTVSAHRVRIRDEALAFGRTDLLCYRAEAPAKLIARQASAWDPLLDWAGEKFSAKLAVGAGIAFVDQPAECVSALGAAVALYDDFGLAALHGAASITGSLILALALAEGRLNASEAFALSRLDETFQSEAWGTDAEAEARANRLRDELMAIECVLRLARP
jgi:chaperone required for assembly of F1-ATPase